jgi:hypothetical protein
MKSLIPALIVLSCIAFLSGVALAMVIWLSPSGGGMFVGLGTVLGWLSLGAGNALSWLLNLLWWQSAGRPLELSWVVAVQGLLVAASAVALAVKW